MWISQHQLRGRQQSEPVQHVRIFVQITKAHQNHQRKHQTFVQYRQWVMKKMLSLHRVIFSNWKYLYCMNLTPVMYFVTSFIHICHAGTVTREKVCIGF